MTFPAGIKTFKGQRGNKQPSQPSQIIKSITITIYGGLDIIGPVDKNLSKRSCYLQQPRYKDESTVYDNPHEYKPPSDGHLNLITPETSTPLAHSFGSEGRDNSAYSTLLDSLDHNEDLRGIQIQERHTLDNLDSYIHTNLLE